MKKQETRGNQISIKMGNMMSDQDVGKKMVEENELEYFIDAYKYVTGEELVVVDRGEKPDFVCERADGTCVGIELTKIMRDPETAHWEAVLNHQEYMSSQAALDLVYETVAKKAEKTTRNDRIGINNTILVLQLMDCPLSELKSMLDSDLQKDFASYGFAEIWIADYTGLDAYGDIELFGLSPLKWWGYHERRNPHRKPYG